MVHGAWFAFGSWGMEHGSAADNNLKKENFKKSAVAEASKSTTLRHILTWYDAKDVDWQALYEDWKNIEGATMTSDLPLIAIGDNDPDPIVIECETGMTMSVAPGETPTDGVATVGASVAGVDETTLELAYQMQGREGVAIVERCSDGKKFIFANPCVGGVTFQYQTIGALDTNKAGIRFTLTGAGCPKPLMVYKPS